MSIGRELTGRIEYENLLKSLPPDERSLRIAMQIYDLTVKMENAEETSKHFGGITGGITGTITAIVIGVISYFTNKRI